MADELWDAYHAERQAKRASNREQSAKQLEAAGIAFERCNDGAHLIVRGDGLVIDFWPGTGKWKIRGTSVSARGVRALVTRLTMNRRKDAPQPTDTKGDGNG